MIGRAGFWIGARLRSDYLKALGEIDAQASSLATVLAGFEGIPETIE
jgi:hypothetical protein